MNSGNTASNSNNNNSTLSLALTPPTTPQSENGIPSLSRIKQIQNSNQLLTNALNSRQSSSLGTADQLLLNNTSGLNNIGLNHSYSSDLLISQNQQMQHSSSESNQDQLTNNDYLTNSSTFSTQPSSGNFANVSELNCDNNLINQTCNNNSIEHQSEMDSSFVPSSTASNNFCFNSLQTTNPATNGSFTINNSFNIYNNGYLANFNPHHSSASNPSNSSSFMNNSYNNYLDQTNDSSINSITAWSNRYISSLHQNALSETSKIASSNASSPSSLSSSSASLLNVSKNHNNNNNSSSILNETTPEVFNSDLLDLNHQTHQLDNHQFINEASHHSTFASSANQLLLANNQPDFCSTYPTQPTNYLYSNWNYS